MAEWIGAYGYPLLFVGAIVEGETFLLMAAMISRNGPLQLPLVMAVAAAGALTGDMLFFAIGKTRGAAFLERRPRWQQRVERLAPLLLRFSTLLILGFRFWYGMRTVVPLVFGASRFRTGRFLALNAVGAAVWSGALGGIGFWLGNVAGAIVADVTKTSAWILAAVLVAVVGYRLRGRMVPGRPYRKPQRCNDGVNNGPPAFPKKRPLT